jgi:ribosomal protein S27AE
MRIRNPKGKYKKTCGKCNGPIEEELIGRQRYCRTCKNLNTKLNRKKHSELTELQKLKANARSYVHVYLKRGKINKTNCANCGDPNVEAHHEDYTKPLEIIWFCSNCHLEYLEKEKKY